MRIHPFAPLFTLFVLSSALGATVTIEPIVRTGDPVPGRPGAIIFRNPVSLHPGTINDHGEVAFERRSSAASSVNTNVADGIYIHRPGDPLHVVADTTRDAGGNGEFAVPGKPDACFSFLGFMPVLNNSGDVVFYGRYHDPCVGGVQRSGVFATTTTGGTADIVKIVDTTDEVPGYPGVLFSNFFSNLTTLSNRTLATVNDAGQVVFWGQFDGPNRAGLFGTTIGSGTLVRLVDNSGTVSPIDQASSFSHLDHVAVINNPGDVVFVGRVGAPGTCCRGVFSVPVTGGDVRTVAFRGESAPGSGTTFSDVFNQVDVNDSGTVVFRVQLEPLIPFQEGVYAGDVNGGPHSLIIDTLSGQTVPGRPDGSTFFRVSFAQLNESGQVGPFARVTNSGIGDDQGIYHTSVGGGSVSRVLDKLAVPPGMSAPAEMRFFDGGTNAGGHSAAINDSGNLVFMGTGLNEVGGFFRGLYFYDLCADEVTRIADTTTAPLAPPDGLGGVLANDALFSFQHGDTRSGWYRAINNSNDVVFLGRSGANSGLFVAHVQTAGGGGQLAISCPDDALVACGSDSSPAGAGSATAVDGCTGDAVPVTFVDSVVADCGDTGTITRTWSADDGSSVVSCDQIITVVDETAPVLAGVPGDATAECDDVPAAASVTASDACDAAPLVTFEETQAAGSCADEYTLTRIWTATDACGNSASASQVITVVDSTAPVVSCPADATELECPADTSVTALGDASASDNCGSTSIVSNDVSVPGCGFTETITRTFTAADDCGNEADCVQIIQTVDTTPPVVSVDDTPLFAADEDCLGEVVVSLPSATAEDDCDGALAVDNDAPPAFPAGGTTVVTYSAADDCGNTGTATVDVTVAHGANIEVAAALHHVGPGTYPGANKEPLVGIEICAYDKSDGSCARTVCPGISHHHYECIATSCPPVGCCTTDADGVCTINVPPGDYVIISLDATKTVLPSPLGVSASDLACGETMKKFLQQIVRADGKKLPGKTTRLTGSELLIIEPEFVVWDNTEQLYPFVFESIGDWGVTVTVTPPEGFVADYDALSEVVDNALKSVQFTVVEIGSELVPTKTSFVVKHNGRTINVRSKVDIFLTADYARSRGFNVPQLRTQGLIREVPDKAVRNVRE